MSDRDGEDFGLGRDDFGEAANGFGVVEAVAAGIVLDGEFAVGFEVVDVAGDGAFGDAELEGHGAGVGERAGGDPVVDLCEAFPGGAAVEDGAAPAMG